MDQIDPQIAARARALADEHARETFKATGPTHAPRGVDDDVGQATFSPLVARLQACIRCVELREGLLIEHVIRLALSAAPNLLMIGKKLVSVTEPDRAVANRNPHVPLDEISVPEPGEPVGNAEIDCVVFDRRAGTVYFIDIKRSGSRDTGSLRIRAGAIAALRALQREGVRYARCELLHVRWFARAAPSVITRDTIDAVLPTSVRATVEEALRHYRFACEVEVRALVTAAAAGEVEGGERAPPQPVRRGDEEAILRAFSRDPRRTG